MANTNPYATANQTNNPFAITGPNSTNNLLGLAEQGIASADTTGYNAATAGSTGFDAARTNAFGYDATATGSTGYDATQGGLTNWNVTAPQTVQGQLGGILAANSPLLQQARAASDVQMNRRGLLNSSMAIGAGQEAVIKTALPIASQDAQTFGRAGEFNAGQANQMSQFNAGQSNQALQFTAGARNQASLANQAASNRASEFGATASNQASLANQQAANQAAQFTASSANQAALANAAAQNQAAQFTAGSVNEASQQYAQALNATVNKMLDQSLQVALSNTDAQNRLQLQNLDAETRRDLAATEAQYKNQMQASASANEIFQQASKNIADIMANQDLEPGPKQIEISRQRAALQNALAILSATSGIRLSDGSSLASLVTFDTSVPSAAPA